MIPINPNLPTGMALRSLMDVMKLQPPASPGGRPSARIRDAQEVLDEMAARAEERFGAGARELQQRTESQRAPLWEQIKKLEEDARSRQEKRDQTAERMREARPERTRPVGTREIVGGLLLSLLASAMGDRGDFTRGMIGGFMQGKENESRQKRQEFEDLMNALRMEMDSHNQGVADAYAAMKIPMAQMEDLTNAYTREFNNLTQRYNAETAAATRAANAVGRQLNNIQNNIRMAGERMLRADSVEEFVLASREVDRLRSMIGEAPLFANEEEMLESARRTVLPKQFQRLGDALSKNLNSNQRPFIVEQIRGLLSENPWLLQTQESAGVVQALNQALQLNPFEKMLLIRNNIAAETVDDAVNLVKAQLELTKARAEEARSRIGVNNARAAGMGTARSGGSGGGRSGGASGGASGAGQGSIKAVSDQLAVVRRTVSDLQKQYDDIARKYRIPGFQGLSPSAEKDPALQDVVRRLGEARGVLNRLNSELIRLMGGGERPVPSNAARKESSAGSGGQPPRPGNPAPSNPRGRGSTGSGNPSPQGSPSNNNRNPRGRRDGNRVLTNPIVGEITITPN